MAFEMVELNELMAKKNGSLNPIKYPDETFELHSIPSFDEGYPEILLGSQIGSSKQIVQENDVMISKIVPHIRRAMVVPKKSDYRQIASGEWIVFRSEMFFPNYLKHLLITDLFNKQFMATVSGVGGSLMRARPSSVAQIKIPLPPLQTQIHIAQVLDKVETLRQKRQKAIIKLDELLKATFIKMFGDPIINDKDWKQDILKNLTLPVLNLKNQNEYHGVMYIDLGSINKDKKYINYSDLNKLSDINFPSRAKQIVNNFDILLSMVRPNLNGVAMVNDNQDKFVASTGFSVLRCNENLNPYYLFECVKNKNLVQILVEQAVGASYPAVNEKIVREVKIAVPPIELQNQFAQIATQIEQQKAKLQTQLDELETLFLALQQRAFSGEL